MKKKSKRLLITLIVSLVFSIAAVYGIVRYMFTAQYNSNGVSHFLVVTIDKEQGKEYLGDLENHKVYIEGFNISETNFRNIKAENVSIKEALEKKLVSIDEWKKYAFSIEKSGKVEILKFDNYEIYIDTEVCIIRPLTK